jgi:hypothetical protein
VTNTASSVTNPFIGPRSFETGERLFGRDREVRDLLHLLIAERIGLLYSPSGAGKSSLIKAALIPALEKKDFVPLPPIRVNQELPLGKLASFTLADYLKQRLLPSIRAAEHDPVLLFDQFEEVLTADPTNVEPKHTFFAQLGEALSDRQLWALFAMREDYLAALDPYLVPIPNRFNDTITTIQIVI